MPTPLRILEALGLQDPWARARDSLVVLRGAHAVPPSRFDHTSLAQLRPKLSIPLWRGRYVVPRRAILSNLFNHRQTPIEEGWSVRMTQMLDFRGRALTYDSHNGTDFAVPIGSTIAAAAPGEVVRVYSEYNRGGHKVVIDHGGGLFTACVHLARFLVAVGDRVERGQPIGISGYSGLDGLVSGPLGVPHTHFSVWLDGDAVDPFARAPAVLAQTSDETHEVSLWLDGAMPAAPRAGDRAFERSVFDDDAVREAIAHCKTPEVRERLFSLPSAYERGVALVCEWNYYPTRFPLRPKLFRDAIKRAPRLTIPCVASEVEGVVFADEL
jgi:murein DD-endopeptidase